MQNSHTILICAALVNHSRLRRDHIRKKKLKSIDVHGVEVLRVK